MGSTIRQKFDNATGNATVTDLNDPKFITDDPRYALEDALRAIDLGTTASVHVLVDGHAPQNLGTAQNMLDVYRLIDKQMIDIHKTPVYLKDSRGNLISVDAGEGHSPTVDISTVIEDMEGTFFGRGTPSGPQSRSDIQEQGETPYQRTSGSEQPDRNANIRKKWDELPPTVQDRINRKHGGNGYEFFEKSMKDLQGGAYKNAPGDTSPPAADGNGMGSRRPSTPIIPSI